MTRICHPHTLQINQRHHEKEHTNINSHMTSKCNKIESIISPVPSEVIAKLETLKIMSSQNDIQFDAENNIVYPIIILIGHTLYNSIHTFNGPPQTNLMT